jgi:hypothetical protein
LNPSEKDEDFLIIKILDSSGQRPQNPDSSDMVYEIDCLKQHYPTNANPKDRKVIQNK